MAKAISGALVASGSMDVITVEERERLTELEGVIGENLTGFVKVGLALKEIRDQRLYRVRYGTFEQYCKAFWDYGKSHVYRNISAAEVVLNLSPIGDKQSGDTLSFVMNEAQIRPLTVLKPAQQKKAWEKVNEICEGKITALAVKKVVSEMLGGNITKKRDIIRDNVREAPKKETPDDFKEAFDALILIFDKYREKGWKGFNRKLALQWVEQLKMELMEPEKKDL